MANTILQVPINKSLRDQATKSANLQGFSSLQEAVRVFLSQLAKRQISLSFVQPTIELSDNNDEHYSQMIKEIKSGKVKTAKFSDTESLIKYLHK